MRQIVSSARPASAPFALAAALALAIGPAMASEPDSALASAMKRDLGLSEQQLGQYLKVERLTAQQERIAAQAQGRGFAGSWIERSPSGDFRWVVATTSASGRAVAGAEMRQVRHSLDALGNAKARLDDVLAQGGRAPAGVYGWYVDVKTNSVTVNVAPGADEAAVDFVARSGADASTLRFQTMADAPRPLATLQGGSEYLSTTTSGSYYCSVGFSVTRNGAKGFATAGHCGDAGDGAAVLVRRSLSRIGTFQASSFPNNDMAWVQVDAAHTLLPSVSGYGAGDVAVRGSLEAPVGAAVCRSGRTTGWKCGVIEAKNVSVSYGADGTVNGTTQVKVCAEGGDSGGSFITSAGQGQGVLSGGNYSCKGKQAKLATSYFQPLNPLLQAYGLTLSTTP
ncbi:S1 family peptidase [Pseudoxanthomonas sp. LH2527]|uniref:S1 family peptidase n=1 Tax=Pseudoxanthomonas sp. LH2527 TaxID=2923249 RepID=UPI001F140815|nr:S1 family peptidase [Pseudoxanthomonas sp. LH2527]MCH6482596.1 S1 family peptidase [Pseudoxanthomonas sp. LH2527]